MTSVIKKADAGLVIKKWKTYMATAQSLAAQATQTVSVDLDPVTEGCTRLFSMNFCGWGNIYGFTENGDSVNVGIVNLGSATHTVITHFDVLDVVTGG